MKDVESWPFDSRLSGDSEAVHRWHLDVGGGLFAIGVGGHVTGHGADVFILDDIQHDAGTEYERSAIEECFTTIAVPRLDPGAAIVCIGTRFVEDDIFGRIMSARFASSWHFVRVPAIAEEGEPDPLNRKPGEALWPQRFSLEELNERRSSMGSRAFEAQF